MNLEAPLLITAAYIGGSVILLAAVLFGMTWLSRRFKLPPELSRKLVHVSLGLYCLLFPLMFTTAWEVAATCALAIGLMMLARGRMRASIGGALHDVSRVSYGEILFATSVALLFAMKDGHYVLAEQGRAPSLGDVLYVVPLLILTLCDAAAAVVGVSYGRRTFKVEEGIKSWEGVVVFTISAWLISLIALLLLSSIDRVEAVLLALLIGLFGAVLEAASWRGLDNLFIPIGLYFVLATLAGQGVPALLWGIAGLASLYLFMWALGRRLNINRHWIATAAALLFCVAIFSGLESALTPIFATIVYGVAANRTTLERPPHDALNLLLTTMLLALACFVFSGLVRIDTIFGFNLTFACLAAGIAGRFGANSVALVAISIVAWAAMAVRTLIIEGVSEQTLLFSALGFVAIVAVGVVGKMVARDGSDKPWFSIGGVSLLLGLASLALAPR